jgi:TRAP-type C4-dicarboxylate transport system permease small subunit
MLQKLSNVLNRFAEMAVMCLMAAISIIIFVQVVSRYAFNHSLYWSEEIGRYILIWITFLGASVGVKRFSHIGIDFIYNKSPEKIRKILDFLIILLGLFFAFVLLWFGYKIAYFVRFQKSAALLMPMTVPYAAIFAGGVLIFIHYLNLLLNFILGKGKR